MQFKKNDELTITITDIGMNGEGIGKSEGYTLFVKDAFIGDVALVKIMKAKKNYGYAKLEKVITPSSFRTNPPCPIHQKCGGCQIQGLQYEKQLAYKEEKIVQNMVRIGGFSKDEIARVLEPIIGMEEPFRYRNKAQYPVGMDKNGGIVTGFYAGHTHSIIPTMDCHLARTENAKILEIIVTFLEKYKISTYDEETQKGIVRHILIRTGFATNQTMVCLVINAPKLPHAEQLVKELVVVKEIVSIAISVNQTHSNVIMGDQVETIYGTSYIEDTIDDTLFRISAKSFYQVNPVQTKVLYSLARDYANLTGNEIVWDLYCGIGTISLFLAKQAKHVYGVEIVEQAILDARENAKINNITNTSFYVGKAEEVLPEKRDNEQIVADVIVVDPPRKGCDEKCLETMVLMQPKRIVYVSCDSATLARDLRYLCDNGYELKKIRGVDQFPHTVHVETVVLLSQLRQRPDDYIEVDVDVAELEGTSAETKATYEKIKKYVAEHNDGMKVSSLYIAQVKRKCGIELAENFNLPKSADARQPQCPKDKEEAITEAFKAFQMI